MINSTLVRYSHTVGQNYWHFEWCTKYRYNMMKRYDIKNFVSACIRKSANEYGITIHILKVMPDHIHILVSLPNAMTDSKARRLLKGRSAYLIFHHKGNLRLRYPKGHFWSAGSFSTTVGYNDLDSITKYIENQEIHHGLAPTI